MNDGFFSDRSRVTALIHHLEHIGQWSSGSAKEERQPRELLPARPVSKPQRRRPRSTDAETVEVSHDMQQLVLQLRLVVAYCNGSTQAEIAAVHGLHVQTVRAQLHNAGVHAQASRAAFAPAEREEVRRLHGQGQSARQLARRYGVTHATVLRLIKSSA